MMRRGHKATTFLSWGRAMAALLMLLPWLLRGISLISALTSLFQMSGVHSGQYAASPLNFAWITGTVGTSVVSFLASFFAQPTNWNTLKSSLDRVFKWAQSQTNLDPRIVAWLEEELLSLLQTLISKWKSPEDATKALAAIDTIRQCQAVSRSASAGMAAKQVAQ